jgi:hypothetical protein
MLSIKLSLVVTLIYGSLLWAQEKKEEQPADEAQASGIMPKDEREYVEKTSKLTTLTNRIADHEKQFQEMVRKKAAGKTAEEKQRWIHALNELVKQRNKDVDQYMKLKSDLLLRYPNQGAHLNRRYETQTKRSLEELEGVVGLDEQLTRTKKIVEKKYAPFEEHDPAKEVTADKPKIASPEEKPARLRLEK